MGTNLRDGNVDRMGIIQVDIDLPNVAANTTVAYSTTVVGVKVGDIVFPVKPSVSAGIAIGGARVSATDTVQLTVINASGGAVNVGSQTYDLLWFRPTPGATLPTAVQV